MYYDAQIHEHQEMKINLGKSKSVSFTRASVKDPLNYSFGDQKIPEASRFKYLGIICRGLSWADQVNYTVQKAWNALYFLMCTKSLECTLFLNVYIHKGK
jgi:hypothetical protein